MLTMGTNCPGSKPARLTIPIASSCSPLAILSLAKFGSDRSLASTDTLAFALHKMDGGGYRHVPVLDKGKPIGVVSVRDMLRHITRLCKDA